LKPPDFELALTEPLPNWSDGIRFATLADHAACAAIGRAAFRFDRYHADTRLDPAFGDRIKEAWVLNDLAGRADVSLVAVSSGTVVGFNLCLLSGDVATIDLIAVAAGHQGRGIGRRLTEAGARHYADRARSYRAGTQANNVASVALYRRLGFRVVAEAVTYHWMPDGMKARI
jgi:ribosomal protein S18 acetylase RimI-like enzyme